MDTETLLEQLRQCATLRSVLAWSRTQDPPTEFVDVVIQDEFHHDVVLRVADWLYAVLETS